VSEDFVSQSIDLPGGELRLLQPQEAASLPDTGPIEWAPVTPYWAVLWRSGVALARELDGASLRGLRVVELGCGLGLPSIVAARAGAAVLATDVCADALALLARNAHANDVAIETARVDWAKAHELAAREPFDLVLAADVLYEPASVTRLLWLMPRLAPEAWLADPGRPAADVFLERANLRSPVETRVRGVVRIHRLMLSPNRSAAAAPRPRPARAAYPPR
jgi:predicted nicotinamide N-methyase